MKKNQTPSPAPSTSAVLPRCVVLLRDTEETMETAFNALLAIEKVLPNGTDSDEALAVVKCRQGFALDKVNRLHAVVEQVSK